MERRRNNLYENKNREQFGHNYVVFGVVSPYQLYMLFCGFRELVLILKTIKTLRLYSLLNRNDKNRLGIIAI